MEVVIKNLRDKDFDMARKFAVEGMHLSWYATNKLELYIYSKYFWYLEITKATRAYGAYMDNKLVGVLLADIKGKPKIFTSFYYRAFVKTISFFINLFYGKASSIYDDTNVEMLHELKRTNEIDGELNFFAVDPTIKGKGIGTLLLDRLEKDEKDKMIYLYTDSGSTYQFYERRGFTMSGKRDITMEIHGKEVALTCYIFSKRF